MRIEILIKAIKDRRLALQEAVFKGDEAAFAKARGIWLGLGEALTVIDDELKKEGNSNED